MTEFVGFDRDAMQFFHELSLEMNRDWFRKNGIKAGDRVEGLNKLPPAQ